MLSGAFAHHSDDAVSHLEDATWAPAEYEYEHLELPAAVSSPGHARRWAGKALADSGLSAGEHGDVALAISELVTNAVRHAGAAADSEPVVIRLAASRERIRIEVSDGGAGFSPAVIARPDDDALGGRGLFVVDAIASRWGTVCGEGHCVWLELNR